MSNRFLAAGIMGCLILPLATAAQQQPPQAAVRLVSTRAETERVTFERALYELENIGGARADRQFDELLKARPESGLLRALWANESLNLTAAQRTRELERAVQDAAKGTTAELVLAAAIRDFRAGRVQDALTSLDAAGRLLPGEPLVEYYRIYWTADPAARLRVAEAAHQKFPGDPGIMNALAYARYNGGLKREGLALIAQYAQAAPNHPNPHDSWAELLHYEGDLAGAAQHYQRALELDPAYSGGKPGLANVAISRGDYATALTHLKAAIPGSREPVERLYILRQAAYAATLANDAAAMRQYFNQAIALEEANNLPASARNDRQWLATMEALLGNRNQAEEILAHPGINTPATPYIGVYRAIVYAVLNDRQKVNAAVTEQEQAAAAVGDTGYVAESVHLARLVRASLAGDVATARSELTGLKLPANVVTGKAFLYRAIKRAKDKQGLEAAKAAALESTWRSTATMKFDAYRVLPILLTR